jgi:uncharacterized membrane protein YqjE
MAAPKRALSTTDQTSVTRHVSNDHESLPSLVSRLGDDVMQLVDSKIALLKVEIKEEANQFLRNGIMAAVAGAIAVIGFALLNIAVALGVSTLFANFDLSQPAKYALGFAITGVFYLVIGGIVVSIVKNRLAHLDVVPNRTVEELRKDKQWLKNEL